MRPFKVWEVGLTNRFVGTTPILGDRWEEFRSDTQESVPSGSTRDLVTLGEYSTK